jgi:hypothetical protein
MRSGGGNVSVTLSGNDAAYNTNGMFSSQDMSSSSPPPEGDEEENVSEQKTTQTSKCKNATTIPIFLKSEYRQWRPKDFSDTLHLAMNAHIFFTSLQ